jgi:hypothetical protein
VPHHPLNEAWCALPTQIRLRWEDPVAAVLFGAFAWVVLARALLSKTTPWEFGATSLQPERTPADRWLSAAMALFERSVHLCGRAQNVEDGYHGRDHRRHGPRPLMHVRRDAHLAQNAPLAPDGWARREHAIPTQAAQAGEIAVSSASACVPGS